MKILPWDSAHFGTSIARISGNGLAGSELDVCLAKAGDLGVAIIEATCSVSDEARAQLLESRGFRYTGTQVHLNLNLQRASIGAGHDDDLLLRMAQEADLDALREMTRGSYTASRYYSYPGIDPERIESLYRIWVEKGVRGTFDDECRILEQNGRLLAFCCLKFAANEARIGLFGVNPLFRRQGNGLRLLRALNPALLSQGIQCIVTTTQAKNIPALRLYENAGFTTDSMDLWFCRGNT